MTKINDFLAMGGYAAYVWPAFAVAAVVLVVLWARSHRRLRAQRGLMSTLEPDRERRGRTPT